MELKDEVAIVTGGGFGIGAAVSLRLAREGVSVAIADLNYDSAKKVADQILSKGGKALPIKTDVCSS